MPKKIAPIETFAYKATHWIGTTNCLVFHGIFFLIAFIAFLFLTKMHERYSLLPLPFLLLATLMNRKLLKWFIILSLISLFNLYHSWPVPKLVIITDVLYLPFITLALSSLNLGLFLVIFIKFRNQKFVEPKKLKVERI